MVESSLFSRFVKDYLGEEDYVALQWHIATHPEDGDVIPGSGGIRKLRWAGKGNGKRGGIRVIYYVQTAEEEIWFLTLYAKNEAATIPTSILKKIKEAMQGASQ